MKMKFGIVLAAFVALSLVAGCASRPPVHKAPFKHSKRVYHSKLGKLPVKRDVRK